MFEREFREEKRENQPRKCSKIAQFCSFLSEGRIGGIYNNFVTLQLQRPLSGYRLGMA